VGLEQNQEREQEQEQRRGRPKAQKATSRANKQGLLELACSLGNEQRFWRRSGFSPSPVKRFTAKFICGSRLPDYTRLQEKENTTKLLLKKLQLSMLV